MSGALRAVLGFDTETTGVDIHHDRIVTAAIVRREAGGPTADGGGAPAGGGGTDWERTWLIAPDIDIPAPASAVHGITTAYAREHGVAPVGALDEIAQVIAQAAADDVPILAFNASFDLGILEVELARNDLESLASRCGGAVSLVIDPLVIDRGVDRWRKGKRTLGDLMAHYGVKVDGDLHDALADVRTAIAIFDQIEAEYGQIGQMPAADLYSWQQTEHRRWADSFNQWLSQRGRTPDVNPEWP